MKTKLLVLCIILFKYHSTITASASESSKKPTNSLNLQNNTDYPLALTLHFKVLDSQAMKKQQIHLEGLKKFLNTSLDPQTSKKIKFCVPDLTSSLNCAPDWSLSRIQAAKMAMGNPTHFEYGGPTIASTIYTGSDEPCDGFYEISEIRNNLTVTKICE